MTTITRRGLMTGAAVAAGSLVGLAGVGAGLAQSGVTAGARTQAPGFQRIRVGDAIVTALLDGFIDVLPEWWLNTPADKLASALEGQFLDPAAPLRIAVNAFVIEIGGQTIAIDAGADTMFGPTAGAWDAAFAAAGFTADQIDTVLISHMHPDHIGGMITGGRAVFPRAGVKVNALELNYWTSAVEQAKAPDIAKPWFDAARGLAQLYDDRLETFTGEARLAPGVEAVPLPGHTPGHTGFLIESAGERLFLWTDVTDFMALQLNAPESTLIFDIDPVAGEASRRRAIQIAASERLQIGGAHIPFPSFGHIADDRGQLRFLPSEWAYEL